jgi:hypothetical protein
VRDADILHLYKKAGWARFLLGLESTDERTLDLIRKGAVTRTDREAIRLMRRHGILSMATWVVGFEEETDRDHWRGLRQLLSYDPDQVQLLYVTPASLDTLFQARCRPSGDPGGSPAVGLQAPGVGDTSHGAVARVALVQVHRDGAAMPSPGDLAGAVSSRRRATSCDALVYADGPPGLAARDPGLPP